MRLIGVELSGYRRFESASCTIDGRLTAIVGPNEAGKSSLLAALWRTSDGDSFDRPDLTRGRPLPGPTDSIVRLWFALDPEDKAAIADIPEAGAATRFIVSKRMDGSLQGSFHPPLRRDISGRKRARIAVQCLLDRPPYKDYQDLDEPLNSLVLGLENEVETLSEPDLELIDQTLLAFADANLPTGEIGEQLEALKAHESRPHPDDEAGSRLLARRPQFLWFGDDERSLQSDYDLAAQFPTSLQLLAGLAGLDLDELRDSTGRRDVGATATLIERANTRLDEVFTEAWRASPVSVRLSTDDQRLNVLVKNRSGNWTSIAERSDGLKTFVAMTAFVAASGATQPILLVDEAERHLHYDAQADLVRVFTRQPLASAIIYTTHSAGCLPEDLGTGVRALNPLADDRSVILQTLWEEASGFSPLVLALGATATAFAPTRKAVLVEGVSDAILLPSLLREATGLERLDYQIAPGISKTSGEEAKQLDIEAPRVVYALDGDSAGHKKRKELVKAGVPASRVVLLSEGLALELEDCVHPDAYRAGVNLELETWHPGNVVPESTLKVKDRHAALERWCKKRGFEAPSKHVIAKQVLEWHRQQRWAAEPRPLLLGSRKVTMVSFHRRISAALGISNFDLAAGEGTAQGASTA